MLIADTEQKILSCFSVLSELRSNLELSSFLVTIRRMQRQGYVLGYLEREGEVASVAGFRICLNLAAGGNALYVYDLVTRERDRSRGLGSALIADIEVFARDSSCNVVHLDSHVDRHRAHGFYAANGFDVVAHHFLMKLGPKTELDITV